MWMRGSIAVNRGERLIRVNNKDEVEMALKERLDSSPALPGWSAGPSPGPDGADSETNCRGGSRRRGRLGGVGSLLSGTW